MSRTEDRIEGVLSFAVLAVLAILLGLALGYVLSRGLTWLVILIDAIWPQSTGR